MIRAAEAEDQEVVRLLLHGLAGMVRADSGGRPFEPARSLRDAARLLGQLGIGDPERLNLISWKWAAADDVPMPADRDRHCVNEQIAELVPGWFS